jgi:hypothetical protein
VACRYECGAHLRSGHQKRIGSPAGDHRVVAGGANACVEEWHLRLVERLAAENHSPPNAALPRAFALAPSGRRSSVILASGVARTQVLDRTLETRLRAQDGGDGPLRLAPASSGASVRNRRREVMGKQGVRRMPRCRLAAGLYLPAPGAHCHTRQSRSLVRQAGPIRDISPEALDPSAARGCTRGAGATSAATSFVALRGALLHSWNRT